MLAVAGVFLTMAPLQSACFEVSLRDLDVYRIGRFCRNRIILHRLHVLWNFGRRSTMLLILGSSAMGFLSVSFAIFSAVKLEASQMFQVNIEGIQGLMACKILSSPRLFVMTWVPAVVIDVFASFFFFLNTLARPRLESQRLLHIFYRDGIMYFLTTFCVRTMNVVFTSIVGPDEAGIFSMGILFSGTMVTVAATRSLLRLFHTSQKEAMCNRWITEGGMDEFDECECCLS
ncbi:hypothetical protein M0805_005851 [Coniferiporia weirii]|nr:hypothetical protein M0805_005851 [Coniferiporia weirii]